MMFTLNAFVSDVRAFVQEEANHMPKSHNFNVSEEHDVNGMRQSI